ncbi:nuclease-related domain-containing protein [Streptomyces sp. NBC_01465]|uniref:nuclease-related domain-containing protein n=1 Tax=Streptomyces sp. NBC_01465 TaxID=2903878 RepID=UPI002E35FC49|nr:nuclease-related domain-containing protein [Streptomyces sp. NBC_01465]
MTGLRITPAWRHSQERLYVGLPDGRNVAWYDRDTSRVSLLFDEQREAVLEALRPFLTGEFTVGPPPVPTPADLALLTLHPDDDLAPNRPGEALHAVLDGAAPPSRFRADPRRGALVAQQALGERLDGLEGAGWRVLHSVPLPGGGHIDHLLIGPAGIMTVRTLYVRKLRVRIADPLVTVGRTEPEPQLRWARREAERASLALAAAVRPVLGLVGAARVEVAPGAGAGNVRILRDGEGDVEALARLGGVLKPADIEALHATARDRRTWLRA